MSPAMAAAAAIRGTITDVRKMRSPEALAVSTAAPATPATVPEVLPYPDVKPIKPESAAAGPAAVGLGRFTKMAGVSVGRTPSPHTHTLSNRKPAREH